MGAYVPDSISERRSGIGDLEIVCGDTMLQARKRRWLRSQSYRYLQTQQFGAAQPKIETICTQGGADATPFIILEVEVERKILDTCR